MYWHFKIYEPQHVTLANKGQLSTTVNVVRSRRLPLLSRLIVVTNDIYNLTFFIIILYLKIDFRTVCIFIDCKSLNVLYIIDWCTIDANRLYTVYSLLLTNCYICPYWPLFTPDICYSFKATPARNQPIIAKYTRLINHVDRNLLKPTSSVLDHNIAHYMKTPRIVTSLTVKSSILLVRGDHCVGDCMTCG